MENNNIVPELWIKRWYDYNKQKIPMIFILIGAFFFTAFLDFEVQKTNTEMDTFILSIKKFIDTPNNILSSLKFISTYIQVIPIKLESHISAIRKFLNSPYNNLSAFYLFAIYLVAIIQLFNSSSFAKKRSPISLFLITLSTILQVAMVGLYTSIFFFEQANRKDYVIDSVAQFSYTVFIIGAAFFILGTFFAWFYVDWEYVKEID